MPNPCLICRLAIALTLAFVTSASPAQGVFKWTDAEGHVHYGDRPPDSIAKKQIAAPQSPGFTPGQDVEVEESVYTFFEINGTTVEELQRGKDAYGPTTLWEGKPTKTWAQCAWRVTWTFTPYLRSPGQCSIDKFKLKVVTTIPFPKWVNKAEGSRELQEKWDVFTRGVRIHEDGHKQNGVRAANEMAIELRKLPPQSDCEILKTRISELGKRVIDKYVVVDQAWDHATVNGRMEDYILK